MSVPDGKPDQQTCQHTFRVAAGMMVDLYICTTCGYETRSYEEYLQHQKKTEQ